MRRRGRRFRRRHPTPYQIQDRLGIEWPDTCFLERRTDRAFLESFPADVLDAAEKFNLRNVDEVVASAAINSSLNSSNVVNVNDKRVTQTSE